MRNKKWLRLLAYVTGTVKQQLLLQNEYLAAENRILRAKLPSRLRLSDPERATLAESARQFGSSIVGSDGGEHSAPSRDHRRFTFRVLGWERRVSNLPLVIQGLPSTVRSQA